MVRGWPGTLLPVGVENLTDEPPPRAVGAFNDNCDTTLHSIRGRFYHFSITKKF